MPQAQCAALKKCYPRTLLEEARDGRAIADALSMRFSERIVKRSGEERLTATADAVVCGRGQAVLRGDQREFPLDRGLAATARAVGRVPIGGNSASGGNCQDEWRSETDPGIFFENAAGVLMRFICNRRPACGYSSAHSTVGWPPVKSVPDCCSGRSRHGHRRGLNG